MKITKKLTVLGILLGVFLFVGLFNGGLSFGQYYPNLTCSPNTQTANVGQSVTVTASGGSGGYIWYALENNLSGISSPTVSVSFQSPGMRYVNVNAGGVSATCNVNVVASGGQYPYNGTSYVPTTYGQLMCSPSSQTATTGNAVTFTASGGNGYYTWYAPNLTLNNPTGSAFTVNYATPGTQTITVSSGGQTATCTLTVSSVLGATYVPTYTLPNTGGGGARFFKH